MHTHGVQVFNRTNDDAVVGPVAYHLHLILFPAEQGLLNQQFSGRRGFQPALADQLELLGVIGNAAAGAPKGKAGADNRGKAQGFLHLPGLLHRVGDTRTGRPQPDVGHGVLELEPVFGLVDGLRRSAYQLDLVFVENTVVPQLKRTVQGGLPPHGGQNCIRALLGNDFLHCLPSDRFNVGHISRGRIGHDGGRIAVDQDHLVTLFPQRLASLNARVIKFTGLANDDRAGTYDQNAFDVASLWHVFVLLSVLCGQRPRALQLWLLKDSFFAPLIRPGWHWPASGQTKQTPRPPPQTG